MRLELLLAPAAGKETTLICFRLELYEKRPLQFGFLEDQALTSSRGPDIARLTAGERRADLAIISWSSPSIMRIMKEKRPDEIDSGAGTGNGSRRRPVVR